MKTPYIQPSVHVPAILMIAGSSTRKFDRVVLHADGEARLTGNPHMYNGLSEKEEALIVEHYELHPPVRLPRSRHGASAPLRPGLLIGKCVRGAFRVLLSGA